MGLDMYLTCDLFIGGNYEHKHVSGELSLSMLVGVNDKRPTDLVISAAEIDTVTLHVGYWRKANAVHGWFVEEIQEGKDECQRSEVTIDELASLRSLCLEALGEKDSTVLPGRSGFFFGSTDADEWYWDSLIHTVDVCDKALAMSKRLEAFYPTFHYQASW